MRTIFLTILLSTFCCLIASAQTKSMNWDDSTRDVYIDGQIDREAQVLFPDSGKQMVLFSSKLKQAVMIDTAAGTVGVVDKNSFKFAADRATAKSVDGLSPQPVGKYAKINDS